MMKRLIRKIIFGLTIVSLGFTSMSIYVNAEEVIEVIEGEDFEEKEESSINNSLNDEEKLSFDLENNNTDESVTENEEENLIDQNEAEEGTLNYEEVDEAFLLNELRENNYAGKISDTLSYKYDEENKILVIEGEGSLVNIYEYASDFPWVSFYDDIEKVEIQGEIEVKLWQICKKSAELSGHLGNIEETIANQIEEMKRNMEYKDENE